MTASSKFWEAMKRKRQRPRPKASPRRTVSREVRISNDDEGIEVLKPKSLNIGKIVDRAAQGIILKGRDGSRWLIWHGGGRAVELKAKETKR
jgi:hypothetical protein